MTPDDRLGEEPTKPLPVRPEQTPTSPTEPVVAAHVPVADLSTAPMESVADPMAGAARARRVLTGGLVSAVAVLGIVVIVVVAMYLQGRDPLPASTPFPTPSPSVTVTPPPTAPVDAPPSDDSTEPTPEPTPTPLPTDPPSPDPTVTPPA